jgi:5-methylcytosine-specific restriction protein A
MRNEWSREELLASVEAYLDMQRKHRAGEKFIKKRFYEDLASRFARTDKSFEYRMQNISYVMTLLGRNWLPGLKPAKNVGANVASEIEELINLAEGRSRASIAGFEIEVRDQLKQPSLVEPSGNGKPTSSDVSITQFQRDASVKAWVLREANGNCECCARPAPFLTTDRTPFLEVHHVRQLADHGSDTITNAVALCPNCHREIHYGVNGLVLIEHLYRIVSRLIRE